jgi:FdhE protein
VQLAKSVRPQPDTPDPAWEPWLALVATATAEAQHPSWSGCARIGEDRAGQAPLLHDATLNVDATRAANLVRQLADHFGVVAIEKVDPLALILGGVERDRDTIERLAGKLAIPYDTVAVCCQLTALPLLINAVRLLSTEGALKWQRGYCPVCGAWPSLAEMRGIQRERRLRCGCCGSDWPIPVLRCAFCDEIDHQKLGFLLNEQGEPGVRVETCSTCRGYLKSTTTLGAMSFAALVRKDLSTIPYDLVARDRGYTRPNRPGWQLSVEIVQ